MSWSRPWSPVGRGWVWVQVCALGLLGLVGVSAQSDPDPAFARVPEILKALDARPGARIADVGAGDGFFTAQIARAISPGGRAVGEDILDSQLTKLRARATREGLTNVEAILGEADDPRLPPDAFDAVLVHNAYHEFTRHEQMLAHIFRALKLGGRFVLVEPFHAATADLPRDEQTAKHDLASGIAERELRDAGFSIIERQDSFVTFTGGDPGGLWMIVAKKA